MKLPIEYEPQFVQAYLKHLDVEAAAREIGVLRNPAFYGRRMLNRPRVRLLVSAAQEERRLSLKIDADFVLQELCVQLGRLRMMLEKDGPSLSVEKEIRATLNDIGRHNTVRAFPAPVQQQNIGTVNVQLNWGSTPEWHGDPPERIEGTVVDVKETVDE